MDEKNPFNKDDISEPNDGNNGETKNTYNNKDDVSDVNEDNFNGETMALTDSSRRELISSEGIVEFHEMKGCPTVSQIIKDKSQFKFDGRNISTLKKKKWNLLAVKGTKLHAAIHHYYTKGKIPEDCKNDLTFKQFLQFEEYRKEHGWKYERNYSEHSVRGKIAARIDMIFKDPDNKEGYIIVDWKRSNRDFRKWNNKIDVTLQLNLYKNIMEKKYNVKETQMFVVQFNPNAEVYQLHKIEDIPPEEIQRLINFNEPSKPKFSKRTRCSKSAKQRRASQMKQYGLEMRRRAIERKRATTEMCQAKYDIGQRRKKPFRWQKFVKKNK